MPQRSDDHPEFLALVESIRDHGLFNPFIIDEADQVMDGRHRLRACRKLGLKEVPCEVRDSSEAVSIALECLMARRHYSKGALAYTALPLLEKASEEAAIRQSAALKKGKKPVSAQNALTGEPTMKASELVASKLGISARMLEQAASLAKAFEKAEEAISRWLRVHGEAAEKWEAWDQDTVNAWTAFRADYCAQEGLDAADAATFAQIPENLREKYLAELFDGEMSIGAINKAIGGALATKGAVRNDKNPDNAQFTVAIKRKIDSFAANVWGQWDELDTQSQAHLALGFAETAAQWPALVQQNMFEQLKQLVKGGAK
jgi:ParB-like chromosome segregation protein Spo0J